MKILDLKFQAFGPFLKPQHIPFNELNDKGMFLINGPTGTGKTTIFDAIVYALYGQGSGKDRNDISLMRSDFAKDTDVTEVYLKFEANGKIYEVKRTAPYMRKALRGDKLTKAEGTAELILPSGEVLSKTSEINNKIKYDILFLDIDQFKNVALLAQGEFTELITASSREREPILEHIFQKEIYAKIQDKINVIASKVDREKDDLVAGLKTLLDQIENKEEIKGFNEAYLDPSNVPTLINSLNEIIALKKKEIDDLDKIIQKRKEEYETSNNHLRDLRQNNKIINTYLEALKIRDTLISNQKDIEDKEIKLEKEHESSLIYPLIKQIKQYQLAVDNNTESIKQIDNTLTLLKEDINWLDSNKDKYLKIKEDLPHLISSLKILKDLAIELSSLHRLKEEVEKKEKKYNEDYQRYLDKENEFIDIRHRFFASSSYNLEKDLKEGEPCPVCGNIHHPNLASSSDPISEATYQEKEKEFKKITDDIHQEKNELDKSKATLRSKEDDMISSLKKNGFKDASLEFIYSNNINNLIKEREDEIKALDSFIKDYEKKNEEVSKTSLRCKTQKEASEKNIKDANEGIKNTKQELEKQFLNNKHLKSVNDYEEYKKNPLINPDSVKKEIEKHKAELIRVNSIINNTPKELIDAGQVDESNLALEVNEKSKIYLELDNQNRLNKHNFDNLEKSSKALEKKYHECEAIIKKYQSINELNNTASGHGPKKLSFKMYILADYFEKIIHQANLRLSRMSGGRYRLIRGEKVIGKGMQGLDLEVFDLETGKNRPASSLSGGEKFVSALSMALGLSDIIESNHALVQVESIFIDEGFGTLDDDYIDMAMKALEKLKDGEKTIAIISHVERLKSYIQDGLEVVKDEVGSKIIMKNQI